MCGILVPVDGYVVSGMANLMSVLEREGWRIGARQRDLRERWDLSFEVDSKVIWVRMVQRWIGSFVQHGRHHTSAERFCVQAVVSGSAGRSVSLPIFAKVRPLCDFRRGNRAFQK